MHICRQVVNIKSFEMSAHSKYHLQKLVLPVQGIKAYGKSRGIAPNILDPWTRWLCDQLHAPVILPPGKEPLFLLNYFTILQN